MNAAVWFGVVFLVLSLTSSLSPQDAQNRSPLLAPPYHLNQSDKVQPPPKASRRLAALSSQTNRASLAEATSRDQIGFVSAERIFDNYGSVVATGDFNGDGKTDLVTQYYTDSLGYCLSVFLSNGNGTFQPQGTTYLLSKLGN